MKKFNVEFNRFMPGLNLEVAAIDQQDALKQALHKLNAAMFKIKGSAHEPFQLDDLFGFIVTEVE